MLLYLDVILKPKVIVINLIDYFFKIIDPIPADDVLAGLCYNLGDSDIIPYHIFTLMADMHCIQNFCDKKSKREMGKITYLLFIWNKIIAFSLYR